MEKPLFWSDKYCALNDQSKIVSQFEVLGQIHNAEFIFELSGNSLKSPGRATFGGIWPSTAIDNFSLYKDLYESLFTDIKGSLDIKIILPPRYFYPEIFTFQSRALESLGFENSFSDFNFHINLKDWFPNKLSKGNRKKIRQFESAGGRVVVAHENEYEKAYAILKANRENRGVKISMQGDRFINNLKTLPTNFKLYVAKIDDEIAAAAYVVRLSPHVNYVLFWGDNIVFRSVSPVASLLNYLVPKSVIDGCSVLDLGISSVDGVLDIGLARFKRNLGAIETLKPTYTRLC